MSGKGVRPKFIITSKNDFTSGTDTSDHLLKVDHGLSWCSATLCLANLFVSITMLFKASSLKNRIIHGLYIRQKVKLWPCISSKCLCLGFLATHCYVFPPINMQQHLFHSHFPTFRCSILHLQLLLQFPN
jgi:hypothetical protein